MVRTNWPLRLCIANSRFPRKSQTFVLPFGCLVITLEQLTPVPEGTMAARLLLAPGA